MSDRMPVFLIAELDYTDVNFRIYSAPLSTLVRGTVCENARQTIQAAPITRYVAPNIQTLEAMQDITINVPTPTLKLSSVPQQQPSSHIFSSQQLPSSVSSSSAGSGVPQAKAYSFAYETQGQGIVTAPVATSRAYDRKSKYLVSNNGVVRYTKPSWWNQAQYSSDV